MIKQVHVFALCCGTHRTERNPATSSRLALPTEQANVTFGAEDIAIKIGDPLPSARRDIEVANGLLDVHRYTAPIELRIAINEIGG